MSLTSAKLGVSFDNEKYNGIQHSHVFSNPNCTLQSIALKMNQFPRSHAVHGFIFHEKPQRQMWRRSMQTQRSYYFVRGPGAFHREHFKEVAGNQRTDLGINREATCTLGRKNNCILKIKHASWICNMHVFRSL